MKPNPDDLTPPPDCSDDRWLGHELPQDGSDQSAQNARHQNTLPRSFDVAAAFAALVLSTPFLIGTAALVRFSSPGRVIHRSLRVGVGGETFEMLKFRTMKVGTPQVATHLLTAADTHLTPVGGLLRKSSLDELPQFVNVLRGDMALVGPRPALSSQNDLIAARRLAGTDVLKPGITGYAQTRGRDLLTIEEKVELEREYLERRTALVDAQILLDTVRQVFVPKGVRH